MEKKPNIVGTRYVLAVKDLKKSPLNEKILKGSVKMFYIFAFHKTVIKNENIENTIDQFQKV